MKRWVIHTNLPVVVIVRLPQSRRGDSQGHETFLPPSGHKQTCNYDRECSNNHPSLSTLSPKGFSRSKMKWWAIHKNLAVDVIVWLSHPRYGNSHGHETFLAPPVDKQTRKYNIECSNHHPSLSTLRPKGLSPSNMKWGAICTNSAVDVIVRLAHLRSGDSQFQVTFFAPSVDKQTCNYAIECSNHHPLLSTLRLKGLSLSKMKWLAIHTNLTVDVIVRLSHPQSWDSQNQETFWAPTAEKPICNYDIEGSKHHPPLSTLSTNELSRSEMKWLTIYTNLPMDVIVRLPHPWSGNSHCQETFLAPSADRETRNSDTEWNHLPSLSTKKPKGLSRSKMKW